MPLIVATLVVPLLQVPPVTTLLTSVVPPTHTEAVPVIVPAPGKELTVAIAVALPVQVPFDTAYDIIAVPGAIPVTIPVDPIVITPVVAQLHDPPATPSDNVIADPEHKGADPEIVPASGKASTVTTVVAVKPDTVE